MNSNLHFAADYAAEQLENYIEIHQLKPHDRLPSERILAAQFGVNRITLREAIQRLENEHLLYSIPGSGTYLAAQKLRTNTGINFSYQSYCQANGYSSSSKVIYFYETVGTDFVCEKLKIPAKSEIFILKRVRYLNQKPAMLETTHIPKTLCPNLNKFDFDKKHMSLYKVLTEEYGILATKTRYSVSMTYADSSSANLLHINQKSPLLSFDVIGMTEEEQIIEYCQTLKRSDLFGINSDLFPVHPQTGSYGFTLN